MKDTEYKYYIQIGASDGDNLPNGLRICRVKNDDKINITGNNVYASLSELINNDPRYKGLLKTDHKRALQIKKRKYVLTIDRIAIFPASKQFDHYSYNVLVHSIRGNISKGNLTGLHYYGVDGNKDLKIIKETKKANKFGVWEAQIEIFDHESNSWVKKRRPTTFFPKSWTLSDLMTECFFSVEKMVKEPNKKYSYYSYTTNRIKVVIIINEFNEFKTIYPIYE